MTSAKLRVSIATIVASALAIGVAAPAIAGPAYLKLGDIKGESTASGPSGQIEIQSWSWGESRSGIMEVGGLKHETEVIEAARKKGKVEYGWKVEEGEKAAASHEAEITLKGAARAGKVKPGRVKVGDVTLKRGTMAESGESAGYSGGVKVATGDIDGDGRADLAVAPGPGTGSLNAVVPAGMCKAGARYATAELGTEGQAYRLTDVIVSSCTAASGGDKPMETMSLNFTRVE